VKTPNNKPNNQTLTPTHSLALQDQTFQGDVSIRFEELLHPDDQSSVIKQAVQVHHHAGEMKRNAMGICLAFYRCREAFGRGAARSNSGPNGWGAFCAANFAELNLSEGNIRAAVRSGEILDKMLQVEPDGTAVFQRLSRAALFALGGSPELAGEVKQILLDNPDNVLTAAEIKDLKQTLRSQNESMATMQDELRQTTAQLTNLQVVSADVNGMLAERESQVVGLIARNDQLVKEAKTPVESLVPTLPPGVKSEAELLRQLNGDIEQKQNELQKVVIKVNAEEQKLARVQISLAVHTQEAGDLTKLEADLSAVINKYPEALFNRLDETTPVLRAAFSEFASRLRKLADLIQPSMVIAK
jgi:hypothetical protein